MIKSKEPSIMKNKKMCDRCGRVFVPVYCHGHLQCAACGQIQVGGDCCQGQQQKESAENNVTPR